MELESADSNLEWKEGSETPVSLILQKKVSRHLSSIKLPSFNLNSLRP